MLSGNIFVLQSTNSPVGLLIMVGAFLVVYVIWKMATGRKNVEPETVEQVPAETVVPSVAKIPASGSFGEIKLNGVPENHAAMAMAIVADEIGSPINELRFISIRKIG